VNLKARLLRRKASEICETDKHSLEYHFPLDMMRINKLLDHKAYWAVCNDDRLEWNGNHNNHNEKHHNLLTRVESSPFNELYQVARNMQETSFFIKLE
jgi:hypothetical protein